MGTGIFTGVKRPGRGVDHPPSSSAHVTPLWAFVASFMVNFTFIFTKHFDTLQKCKRNQLFHHYGNNEHFYMLTVTSKPTTIKREHTVALPWQKCLLEHTTM